MSKIIANSQKKIRFQAFLFLFFIVLAGLGLFLAKQAYDQLQWEAFHRFQSQAQELSERLERNVVNLLQQENKTGFADYSFTIASGSANPVYVQLSPLATIDASKLPGFLGYFQLDNDNRFSTPLLPFGNQDPHDFGFNDEDIRQREQKQKALREILAKNQLIEEASQRNVVELLERNTRLAESRQKVAQQQSLEKFQLEDLREKAEKKTFFSQQAPPSRSSLPEGFANTKKERKSKPAARVQREWVAENEILSPQEEADALISTSIQDVGETRSENTNEFSFLESRIEAFSSANLASGHILFYRHIWQQKQRYIQGFILERKALLEQLLIQEYLASSLSNMSSLALVWQDQVQEVASGRLNSFYSREVEPSGSILYKHVFPAPLEDWDLLFTVERLPSGPGLKVLLLSSVSYLLVLAVACWVIYRFLEKQIAIAQQQQDFVSSISHELKTPLTSIRMYGEMLREGWVNEDKKREYYNYIFYESERLSRLINNILQLARMTRSELPVNTKALSVSELFDLLRSTLADQVARAGFELNLQNQCEEGEIEVDPDLMLQVLINLVDNALKFSRDAEIKRVDISAWCQGKNLEIEVCDYGPGVDSKQAAYIFDLFYRAENELTRETKGTGIGLALVRDLLKMMNASINLQEVQAGASFKLIFPLKASAS